MGLLLIAGLVAVVTSAALSEGLHLAVCIQSRRGRWERGEGG